MSWRFAVHGLVLAVCAALVGCGGKAPPKGGAIAVRPVVQTRKDLFDIAKKIEDPASFATLETDVQNFEKSLDLPADDPQRWTWAELSERIIQGNYSDRTKSAFEDWRKAKMSEDRKR